MSHKVPTDLFYTKEDEWVKVEGDIAAIGITDFAQDALSDIVYLEIPDAGETIALNDEFGVVESVKAAADLFAPLTGEVIAANEDLVDAPEVINDDPYGSWMIKIQIADASQLEDLMTPAAYHTYCEERQ